MKLGAIQATQKNHDALLLVLASFALLAELSLLFHQLRLIQIPLLSSRGPASTSGVGEVIKKARSVQSRSPGSLTWYPVVEGDTVVTDETVMTGAGSTAVIRINNGGELVLEPFTLLRFGEQAHVEVLRYALEIHRGSLKVRSQDTPVRVTVQSRELELKPRTEVLVSTPGSDSVSELEVVSGEVSVARKTASSEETAPAPTVLAAGEAIEFQPTGELETKKMRLEVSELSPGAGSKIFVASGTGSAVEFRWQGDDADVLEWDITPEMSTARRVQVQGHAARVTFAPGKYFWRLAHKKALSGVMEFSVLTEAKYRLHTPTGRVTLKEGMAVSLRWDPVPDAESYVVEVSHDRGFSRIVRREEVVDNQVQIGGLPTGRFYCRVQAVHAFLGDWPQSSPFEFVVRERVEPPQPTGAKVLPKRENPDKRAPASKPRSSWWNWDRVKSLEWLIPSAYAAEEKPKIWLEFTWEETRSAKKGYRLEVSTRKDFKVITAWSRGEDTRAVVEVPDRARYYWRVAAIDEDGDLGKFSEVQVVQREVAKVVEAPKVQARSVASGAPGTPAVAIEPPEPPRSRFFRIWAGYGGGVVAQNMYGEDYWVRSTGLPGNRLVAGTSWDFRQTSIELHVSYQPMRFNGLSGLSDFSMVQWGGDVYWSRLWNRRRLPIGIGLRARRESSVVGGTLLTAELGSAVFGALLVGTDWSREGAWPWKGSAWLELAPVGYRRGLGVIVRNRVGLPFEIGGVRPSAEFVFHPHFRNVAAVGSGEWNLEASLALVMDWEGSLPTLEEPPQ